MASLCLAKDGPLFIRMAWHSAGTYRTFDGRGGANTGNQRFAPLNSWPDNGNLDKARRLLWPVKAKYGKKLSWGDLMIFAGDCAMESMGFKPFGTAFGREDIWEPEEDIYWGPEADPYGLADERHPGGLDGEAFPGNLEKPLGAVQMGLIYVNPQGPGGNPDPVLSGKHIRETFGRMAMNDEETVALIAGGHTFGKAHGAANPDDHVGPEPEGASIEEQGFGWKNSFGTGKGVDTITSGLEGAWTTDPIKWDHGYFHNLFTYDWELSKSPAGATQWTPTAADAQGTVPDAHDPDKRHAPVMFTTDLALKFDPIYAGISKKFHEDPKAFEDAFARAWYKLTHRDMGPITRCLGPLVAPVQIWQDPVPDKPAALIGADDIASLKASILGSGLSAASLVRVAWGSASTYRKTDHRGGANGGRIRLAPQRDWAVNNPAELGAVLAKLEEISAGCGKEVSIADLIVLGGCAAVEDAAKKGGVEITVPFSPGRTDATDEQTDADSFSVLEPTADAFRNHGGATPHQLVDRAHMLNLTAPEMTVLVGGLRVLGANADGSSLGVLTATPGTLNSDFFINLLDMATTWEPNADAYDGKDMATGEAKWTASQVDLVFGSNSELRAIAEYYGCEDSKEAFVADFVRHQPPCISAFADRCVGHAGCGVGEGDEQRPL